jgi:prolipoprotein diacylglyceryl transferase
MPKVTWDVAPTFWIGDQQFRYYSLCMIATFIGGYVMLSRQLRRGGADTEEAGDFLSYGIIALLAGARLGHVLFYDFDKVVADPVWALQIWKGGLASHGAAVGLAAAMWLFTKRRAIPFLEGADRLVPSAALGAVVMRVGNLFNSEIVGKPTDQTWGVAFPRYDDTLLLRHPSQLYEAPFGLCLLVLLFAADRWWGRERRPRGALTGLFLSVYFLGRFLVEFIKEPEGAWSGALNTAQWLSVPGVLIGLWVLAQSLRDRKQSGWTVAATASQLPRS